MTLHLHVICKIWSEILYEIVLDKYTGLCVCMCTSWDSVRGSYVVFCSWRCLLWVSFEKGCHQKDNITQRFIYHYFLTSCATCSSLLGPAHCNGTIAWPSPHRKMTWGSLSRVTRVHPDFCHLALGLAWPWDKCPVGTCLPLRLTLLGLRWALAFALICLGFMPKHPSSNASRWRGEKLNNLFFASWVSTAFYKTLQR